MTNLFKDVLEWTVMMTPLLDFGNSTDFEKQLEIQMAPPWTVRWLTNSWFSLALDPRRWSDFGIAVGRCFLFRVAIGRHSTSEVAAESLTPQPAPFAKFEASDIYKRVFCLFIHFVISDLQNSRTSQSFCASEFSSGIFFFLKILMRFLLLRSGDNG